VFKVRGRGSGRTDLTSEELAALQRIDPAEVTAEDRDVATKMDMNAIVIWTPDSA
jgi:hypothetical protein